MLAFSTQSAKEYFNDILCGQIACPKMSHVAMGKLRQTVEVCIVNLHVGNIIICEQIKWTLFVPAQGA
jgi:hypothetical protein